MFFLFLFFFLYIGFVPRANETHTFAESQSQAEFDGCVKEGLVFDSTIFITLDRPGRRYFMYTDGNHCNMGMKFAIDVFQQSGTGTPRPNAAVKVGALPMLFFTTMFMANFFFLYLIYGS